MIQISMLYVELMTTFKARGLDMVDKMANRTSVVQPKGPAPANF